MFRPTPGRLFYLLVGLIIGAIALFVYTSVAGTPAFLATLPTSRASTPLPKAQTQFSGSALTKVLGANQAASKGGIVVRVNTVEVYGDGFGLTYSILSGQPGEPAPVLQPEQFGVIDDRGVSYRLSAVASSSSMAPGMSTGYLAYTPAVSPDAHTLTVTVPHLLLLSGIPETGAPHVVDGPWQIQVPLR
jgi:hypothetical protein